MDPPIPSVIAIIVCERVIEEARTTKKSLIGIFSQINAQRLPFTMQLGFYARMTDAEGAYVFRVEIICLNTNQPVARLEARAPEVKDRLGYVELGLNLPVVPFTAFGRYEFQLYGNDVYLGHVAIDVKQAEGTNVGS